MKYEIKEEVLEVLSEFCLFHLNNLFILTIKIIIKTLNILFNKLVFNHSINSNVISIFLQKSYSNDLKYLVNLKIIFSILPSLLNNFLLPTF